MQTIINWNKTSEGVPPQTVVNCGKDKKGKDIIISTDDECLVIHKGKVKRSRYLTDQQRWEGHLKDQTPEYWFKIRDLEIVDDSKL